MEEKPLHFPSTGTGINSHYYDDELLFSGDYQLTSCTLHNSSRDLGNSDTKELRKGLLIVKSALHDGYYIPLNTGDGYLNGNNPSQFITDTLVLAENVSIDKVVISNDNRVRETDDMNVVVSAYLSGSFLENVLIYNNMEDVTLTQEQLNLIQRINIVPSHVGKYVNNETYVRSLLFRRKEIFR